MGALISAVSAQCAWKGPLLKGDARGTFVAVSVFVPALLACGSEAADAS